MESGTEVLLALWTHPKVSGTLALWTVRVVSWDTFLVDVVECGNLVDYTPGAMGLHMPYEERLAEFHGTLPADYEPPALISMERWPVCFNYRLFPGSDDLITVKIRRQLVEDIVDMLYEMLDDSVRRTGTPENAEDPSISERVQPDVYTRNSVTLFPELA
jgi:hypothetical protein